MTKMQKIINEDENSNSSDSCPEQCPRDCEREEKRTNFEEDYYNKDQFWIRLS